MSQEADSMELLRNCGYTNDQIYEAYERYHNWEQAADFLLDNAFTLHYHEEERKNNPDKPTIRIGPPALPQKIRIINEEHSRKITICLQGKNFPLLIINPPTNFQFDQMYFDQLIQLDRLEFPGIIEIERIQSHSDFLVCKLKKDTTDEYSKKMFRSFKNLLTKAVEGNADRRILFSNHYSYERKCVFLICHQSEHTGFGQAVREAGCDFCLFEIPCKLWYNAIDPLELQVEEFKEREKILTRNFMLIQNKLKRKKVKIGELKKRVMYR